MICLPTGSSSGSRYSRRVFSKTVRQMLRTDSEGKFEVKGLPAGAYMVNPIDIAGMQRGDDAPGMEMNFETVTITEGGDVTVTFGGGVAVSGTIPAERLGKMTIAYLMRKGAPEMPNMSDGMNPFEMMESGMDMFQHMLGMASVEDDGTFNFKGIDPGEYELRVYASPMGVEDIDPTQFMNMSLEEMQQQSQAFAPKEVFKQPVTVGDSAVTVKLEQTRSIQRQNKSLAGSVTFIQW